MKTSARKKKFQTQGQIQIDDNELANTISEFRTLRKIDKYVHKHKCDVYYGKLIVECRNLMDSRRGNNRPVPEMTNAEIAWLHSHVLRNETSAAQPSVVSTFVLKVAELVVSGIMTCIVGLVLHHLAKPYFPYLVHLVPL